MINICHVVTPKNPLEQHEARGHVAERTEGSNQGAPVTSTGTEYGKRRCPGWAFPFQFALWLSTFTLHNNETSLLYNH